MEHIAIIMDGNRRWAKEKNLLPSLGHLYLNIFFIKRILNI